MADGAIEPPGFRRAVAGYPDSMPNLPEVASRALYGAGVAAGGGLWAFGAFRSWSTRMLGRAR